MRYEGQIYRPPVEASSLIIQATIGCPWNRCAFCAMYKDRKFRTRPVADVLADLDAARAVHRSVPSLFLADGNTISLPTDDLLAILGHAHAVFPELAHVGTYGGAKFIIRKSVAELAALRDAGLSTVYLGLESGDDETLARVQKGVTAAEMIEAGTRLREAGFPVSLYVLVGLGGKDRWREHALGTAAVINAIRPAIVRPRTLYVQEGTPLWYRRQRGEFVEAGPGEALQEVRLLLDSIIVPVQLASDHITNYLPLYGRLPDDRAVLVAAIDRTLGQDDLSGLRPAHFDHL
jgi:radical SAM superfamily enzyme YgiQ (UPF0313 family)